MSKERKARGFVWPAEVRTITSGLGEVRSYGAHEGIDIAPTGAEIKAGRTRVFAIAPGRVERTGFAPKGYGHYIVVRHPDGATSTYGHLSQIAVREGQMVGGGGVLGRMGSTGYSTGTHLHLTVRDPQGRIVNPLELNWGGGTPKGLRSQTPGPGFRDRPPAQSTPKKLKELMDKIERLYWWSLGVDDPDIVPDTIRTEAEKAAEGLVGDPVKEAGEYITQEFWPNYGPDIIMGAIGLMMIGVTLLKLGR